MLLNKWRKAVFGSARRTGRARASFQPSIELLEDRSLPSTSIPLNPTSWTTIGPAPLNNLVDGNIPNSGRVAGLAAHPTNASILYVATAGGGVWKTSNAGSTWVSLLDSGNVNWNGVDAMDFMGAIALAPSNPNIIYVGTGESTTSLNSFYGRGVLKSVDGGATWDLLGNSFFDRRSFSRIVVDAANPNTVFGAVVQPGNNGGPGNASGIWKSTDGGVTWTVSLAFGLTGPNFTDLAMDPNNSQVLYAAAGDPFGNNFNGVYKTADGGANWAVAGNFPMGSNNPDGSIKLAISRSSPATVYASIADATTDDLLAIYKTTNSGATWAITATSAPNYLNGQGSYDNALAVDPINPSLLYAGGCENNGGTELLIKTANGGLSWTDISSVGGVVPHTDIQAMVFDANGKLIIGNDGGLWRLDPTRWTNINGNLNTIQFTGVALNPSNDNIAYGGSQDNGSQRFNDSLIWLETVGGDGGFVRVDFTTPTTVYHEFQYGNLERSTDGGFSWTASTTGINPADPVEFYAPYVLDPGNSSRLLTGTDRVYETINKANLWAPISPSFGNTITALATAPGSNTIYVADSSGIVYVTTNHGGTWSAGVLPGGAGQINDMLVDPASSQTVYAVYGDSSFGFPHVFRSTNGGASWASISSNLPDLPTWAITMDPVTNTIFVGTDNGVYASNNGGASWARFATGLPTVQVRGLDYSSTINVLLAGTHGRGAWEILTKPNSISGQKFNDLNRNGSKDAGEPGLPGWTIFIDTNNDGILNAGEVSTTTDASGNYSFANLGEGILSVREVQQVSWTRTTANPGLIVLAGGGSSRSGVDFGNFQLNTISGQKYHDLDGNGSKDAGEPGVAGWTIFLDSNNNGSLDAGEPSTTTDVSGNYSFPNLDLGTFRVLEVQQSAWVQITQPAPVVFATGGVTQSGVDFGNLQVDLISGQKFNDLNANGVKDAGEPGLAGWTIFLDANSNGSLDAGEPSTTTDAAGNYSFTVLPGTYVVREVPQAGWLQLTANPGPIVFAANAQTQTGVDFGNFRTNVISGQKFNDLNGNGFKDAGEPGLAGWTIFLDGNGNGTLDGGETSTITDAAGNYSFSLVSGTYTVREVQQAGWSRTTANPAVLVLAGAGQTTSGINFGNFQLDTISGQKFEDLNKNGIKDAGEPGLPGWTIFLDTNNNGVLNAGEVSTTTDAAGNYSFGVLKGSYLVREVQQPGWVRTTTNPAAISFTTGSQSRTGVNFGNFQLNAITGQKFNDLNDNGVKDAGEPGLAGWTIFLDTNNNGVKNTGEPSTTTDAAGNYFFTLNLGTYNVREVQQAGWTRTTANPAAIVFSASGQTQTGVDFGNFQFDVISGQKFNDLNNNGIKDAGEPGLANWTIFLDANSNGTLDAGETSTLTNTSGNYTFSNLALGTYLVREVQQAGWSQTTPNPAAIVFTAGSQNQSAVNFGNFQFDTISGQKFHDLNSNGIKVATEPGLANWTIFLDGNGNGSLDAGETSTVTDAAGNYSFGNLLPGTYSVREVQQAGFTQSTANPVITFTAGSQKRTSVNIGNFQFDTITGQKFSDLNNNKVKDAGEPGLQGWTIYLDSNGNSIFDAGEPSAVTDVLGNYTISNLLLGTYRVREVQQPGWIQTTANPPNVIFSTGGRTQSGVNFGNFQLDVISGQKFNDLNDNGAKDAGEPGLPGWTIFLDTNNNGVLNLGERSTTTDAAGNYSFTVVPGTYTVREVQKAGWTRTTANPAAITFASNGQTQAGVDFGNFQADSISGQKFNDANTNGVKDATESGLQGWTIFLDANGNGTLDPGETSTITGASGNYSFTNLPLGTYLVREVPQAGWTQITANPPAIVFAAGSQTQTGVNFGNAVTGGGGGGSGLIAVGADAGSLPKVEVFDTAGTLKLSFLAYESTFGGGVRVASSTLNGVPVVITAPGPGHSPLIEIWDVSGTTAVLRNKFFAYNSGVTGGAFVAAGDLNGDTIPDVVVGAGSGWLPQVEVFNGTTLLNAAPTLIGAPLYPFASTFKGGVTVAAGSGLLVVGAGPGGPPLVNVYTLSGTNFGLRRSFAAFPTSFTGGVFVAVGDFNGDASPDVVVGAGAGWLPMVSVFDGTTLFGGTGVPPLLCSFFANTSTYKGGVHVATTAAGNAAADIWTSTGPLHLLRHFTYRPGQAPLQVDLALLDQVFAHDQYLG